MICPPPSPSGCAALCRAERQHRAHMAGQWTCRECKFEENEEGEAECASCGEARPAAAPAAAGGGDSDSPYAGFVCGLVLAAEAVAGKDKLLKLSINVGKQAPITVVTNAPNVHEGSAVVVATVGSTVREGGPGRSGRSREELQRRESWRSLHNSAVCICVRMQSEMVRAVPGRFQPQFISSNAERSNWFGGLPSLL